ncbi:GNAT family N-acetyltransferase [Neptuniibacter sp. QD57_21]|uniref:GNAT family N-acetyltransferase n=1 Tax=Neptuniibacter sp. QD57_21 TaxID=3398213 RepID=UPI0039F5FE03
MEISNYQSINSEDIIDLYQTAFTDSAGEGEGLVLKTLVTNLIDLTPADELLGFVVVDKDCLIGAIFFSRFFIRDDIKAFLLSPVVVATKYQGQGIGKQLIAFGLERLKLNGVNLVITYGDPNFYSRVGFHQITTDLIRPPYPLTQPVGWMAQRLDGCQLSLIAKETRCVKAFCEKRYW